MIPLKKLNRRRRERKDRIEMENRTEQNGIMKKMPETRYEYKYDGLPFEEIDPDCAELKDFNRISKDLLNDLDRMESYGYKINRFSDYYRTVSRGLENLVRKLGSVLITAAVLEQQGTQVIIPEELTLGRLYFIANYHFNKSHAAVRGTQMYNPKFYIAMLAQEVRWASLLERLDATEQKIKDIREGKTVITKKDRKPAKPAGKPGADSTPASVSASGPSALPVISEFLPDDGQKQETKPQKSIISELAEPVSEETEEIFRSVMQEMAQADGRTADAEAAGEAETGTGEVSEKMMRDTLMGAAVITGNRELYELAAAAGSEELRSVWDDFIRIEAQYGYPTLTAMRKVEESMYDPPPDEDQPLPLDEALEMEPAYCL